MVSATQRTLAELRKRGYKCWIVEKFIKFGKFGTRQDLFNIIDILALDKTKGVIGVQSTVMGGNSAHLKKLLVEERQSSIDWLETPSCFLELWSWRKLLKKRGGKAVKWEPKITEITLAMLQEVIKNDKEVKQ